MTVPAMEEQEDKRGFKVQDRRRFSPEGEAKEGVDAPAQSSEPIDLKAKAAASVGQTAAEQPASTSKSSESPPELTFAAFLWSLSEQALAALGEIADPMSGKVTHDLTLAQQMIDIIIMLRDKTRGNLDPHEAALIKEILSSLQMKYVELARQPNR